MVEKIPTYMENSTRLEVAFCKIQERETHIAEDSRLSCDWLMIVHYLGEY